MKKRDYPESHFLVFFFFVFLAFLNPARADTPAKTCSAANEGASSCNKNACYVCSGGAWIVQPFYIGDSSATCGSTYAGLLRYNSNTLQYCNGTAWTSPGAGTGTANYVARWTNSTTLGTGALVDTGTNVGIGTTTPSNLLSVGGNADFTGTIRPGSTGVTQGGSCSTEGAFAYDLTNHSPVFCNNQGVWSGTWNYCSTGHGSQTFVSSGTFSPPDTISYPLTVKVVVVGGGGGGGGVQNSYFGGGGGSGYVNASTITLSTNTSIAVTVGSGGAHDTVGSASSFGSYLSSAGGGAGSSSGGGSGGSGGGMWTGSATGPGGSNGTAGGVGGGAGQGTFLFSLTTVMTTSFCSATFAAGPGNGGGYGGGGGGIGGGGGGGLLINGAESSHTSSAEYGSSGAAGVVYVEW
ncbi:MAG: glycine-rich domain-containing protein [Bdellovibrionales bacterium]